MEAHAAVTSLEALQASVRSGRRFTGVGHARYRQAGEVGDWFVNILLGDHAIALRVSDLPIAADFLAEHGSDVAMLWSRMRTPEIIKLQLTHRSQ